MLIQRPEGLYCPAGNFYIDPSRAVDHAVITHAHSDHARRGSKQYYCTTSGESLLRSRIGQKISARAIAFGEPFILGEVRLSFHPAGHILGSAQVRMEHQGKVWVASGDYKRDPDPTCEPFEVVTCDVFVTEATFGTPGFRWKKGADLGREIYEWWRDNNRRGVNSLVFAYSLGKAQRVLGELWPHMPQPVYIHPSVTELTECYRAQGIDLAPTICLSTVPETERFEGELVLAPQSFLKTTHAAVLGDNYKTAFASGWMARGTHGYDQGFLMSDHADWDDLLQTIQQTKARRIYVQHRDGALVRHLKALGLEAMPVSELVPLPPGRAEQLSLF